MIAKTTVDKWRDEAKAVIAEVCKTHEGGSYCELKRALFGAYPFRLRQYYPYKVWCEEQRKALAAHPEAPRAPRKPGEQCSLFDGTCP